MRARNTLPGKLLWLYTGLRSIEWDKGVYGVMVLSFFSSGFSVILILMCSIVLSSTPAVCGFLSFWLMVLGKGRSFTVSSPVQSMSIFGKLYFTLNGKWLHNLWQLFYNRIVAASNGRAFQSLHWKSQGLLTFSRNYGRGWFVVHTCLR